MDMADEIQELILENDEVIVSLNQGAFVEGQWIAENTFLTHELVHKVKKHTGRMDLCLLKLI